MPPKKLSLEAYIRELERIEQERIPRAAKVAVSYAAAVILKQTRVNIGHYLNVPGVADMPMAALADSTISDRIRAGYSPDEPGLREYGPDGMRYTYQTTSHSIGLQRAYGRVWTNAVRAVVFELGRINGTNYQPPRRVLGAAVVQQTTAVLQVTERVMYRALSGAPIGTAVKDVRADDGGE